MHPQVQRVFDEAETRYLKIEELNAVGQYVSSLPRRLDTYRKLRDSEVAILQQVATQLQAEMSEPIEVLERSIKNALVVLRYCAFGMLLDDTKFVEERLLVWLRQTTALYINTEVDSTLYRLLNQQLNQTLSSTQLALLKPMLALVEGELTMPKSLSS
jgi:hypothetical protein